MNKSLEKMAVVSLVASANVFSEMKWENPSEESDAEIIDRQWGGSRGRA